MWRFLAVGCLIVDSLGQANAHDIPNARVDRSIQATVFPGHLRVDYEVSLSELTLVQDFRRLSEELSGSDRKGLFDTYGRVVGPLNARGLLGSVNGTDFDFRVVGFVLAIDDHPRYTFQFEAEIPRVGRLTLNDTNYLESQGSSRLAVRAGPGLAIQGDDLPADVSAIPLQDAWKLSDAELARTRRVSVAFRPLESREPRPKTKEASPLATIRPVSSSQLSHLLDREGGRGWPMVLLASFFLGGAHAIQPGHGKTLVAAASLEGGGGLFRGGLLGLATALAHLASVALIALGVWLTRASDLGHVHVLLARSAGFAIAAIGLWRLGRHLAGYGEGLDEHERSGSGIRGLITLGVAGGLVPCWDAVALVVFAAAVGRLGSGLALLGAFSLGLAAVLVAVGAFASRIRSRIGTQDAWGRRLGIASGVILAGIGGVLLGS